MSNSTKDYQRIPVHRFSKSQCFLGTDHLLHIRRSFYIERYKRLYYKDIQSVVLQSNSRQLYKLLIWGALFLIGILLAMPTKTAMVLTGLVTIPFFVYALWLGPHCAVYVITAVQREKILGLNTMKRAQKAMAYLVPKIEEAQRDLVFDAKSTTESIGDASPQPNITKVESLVPFSDYNGWAHGVYYLLLLAHAAFYFSCFYSEHVVFIQWVDLIVGVFSLVFFIVALMKQQQSRLTQLTLKITYISMAYWGISMGLSTIYVIINSIRDPAQQKTQWELIQEMLHWSPHDGLSMKVYFIINISSALIFGILGLLTLKKLPKVSATQNHSSDLTK